MEVPLKGMHSWFLVLLVISVSTLTVDSQLDSNGFISIDCGGDENSSFVDVDSTLTYVSDDQFIDTGVNYKIASQYATDNLYKKFLTVRSFPEGTRNCYTLKSLTEGSKYLVRGTFMYGNYDKKNKLPIFDIHLGVNYWDTVKITTMSDVFSSEIITTSTSDYLQVCLIDIKQGTPFISTLELRPLERSIYADASSSQALVSFARANIGATDQIRYPSDVYDRIWIPYMSNEWINISTSSTVDSDPDFATPSLVMQTAATTSSTYQSLDITWTWDNDSTTFIVILHIAEIESISSTDYREIDIYSEGIIEFTNFALQDTLYAGYAEYPDTGYTEYNLSLVATSYSTLPPLLNALELYIITPTTGIPTNNEDVTAINAIKTNYKINKGWSGDPCVPKEYTWASVTCTFDSTNIPRITELDLSKCGLTGAIISSFGNLSALKSLDLSHNDLSGDLPLFLDKLSALTYLDITGNKKLSTNLPPGLQSKKMDGNLIFMYTKNNDNPIRVIIAVVASVVGLLLIAAAIITVLCLRRRRTFTENQSNIPNPDDGQAITPQAYNQVRDATTPEAQTSQGSNNGQNYANASKPEVGGILDFQNHQYSYSDLVRITNKFQNHIGTGGFGNVYMGVLDVGTQVAVKMRSSSSSQGVKEFQAEAKNLARAHHKNLVSLIGYCLDGDCMALVYEYMQEGTLHHKLRDIARPLSWIQRVRIAYESALANRTKFSEPRNPFTHCTISDNIDIDHNSFETTLPKCSLIDKCNEGLEYLHKACNPPLIHRDVKTSNILLNENLEAKIADFGLSRAFNSAANTHVSTAVMGTPGYLDPEYYSTFQLTVKSDVFSFGVVLLEIVTGKTPTISGPQGGHLKDWVNKKLSRGDIESIVDPIMQGQYDINSVWNVTELARKCTEQRSARRPTMSMVVAELMESLNLEISAEKTHGKSTNSYNPHNYWRNENLTSDVSQNSGLEMVHMGGMSGPGPQAR